MNYRCSSRIEVFKERTEQIGYEKPAAPARLALRATITECRGQERIQRDLRREAITEPGGARKLCPSRATRRITQASLYSSQLALS
jgi:hypothetical protein